MVFGFFVLLTTSVELQMSCTSRRFHGGMGKLSITFMVSSDMHERKISCCICGVAWWRLDSRKKNCPTFAANFGMILLYLKRDRGVGMSLAVQAMAQVFNSYRHWGTLMRSVSPEWELLKYY